MNVSQDLSLISLIGNASVLVQLVLALLLLVSMISWWFIFRKLFVVRDAMRRTDQFERSFWSGADLGTLYQAAAGAPPNPARIGGRLQAPFARVWKRAS